MDETYITIWLINGSRKMTNKINQYPLGKDLLWMAHYRPAPPNLNDTNMNGIAIKISGTMIQAAKTAQKKAEEENLILQCLRRRY